MVRGLWCGAAFVLIGGFVVGRLADYGSYSASEKQSYLWGSIMADVSSDSFMNPITTVIKVADTSYLWLMQNTHADWREATHHKATHGIGAHALAHFEWLSNEYTGMFQQADHCIVRMANAAAPGGITMGSYGPNLAVKCLRDGVESANLQFIWQIDGYAVLPSGAQSSCSYFEGPLSNHCAPRSDVNVGLRDLFISNFNKVDAHSMHLSVAQMAEMSQDGAAVTEPNFPWVLLMQPANGLNDVPCTFNEPISQLLNLDASGFGPGSVLFDVFAVKDPVSAPSSDALTRLGSLVLDSSFTSSKYGDTQLFFRHTFTESEMELLQGIDAQRASEWSAHLSSGDFYATRGPDSWVPFLPTTDRVAAHV